MSLVRLKLAFLTMPVLGFCIGLASCQPTEKAIVPISTEGFIFKPTYKGGTGPTEASPGTPVPPENFRLESLTDGSVKVSWTIPKSYTGKDFKIGYKVFRKQPVADDDKTWDFSSASIDRETLIFSLPAKDCRKDGYCALRDYVGGPASLTYAVIAYWDIDNILSTRSTHREAFTTSTFRVTDLKYGEKFAEKRPSQIIGSYVSDAERKPLSTVFNFVASSVPWFLLDATQSQLTAASWAKLSTPLFADMDSKTGLDLLMPDEGYSRAIKFSKGSESDCDIFKDNLKPFCAQLLIAREMAPKEFVGQQTQNFGLDKSANPLPTSRKFKSRATSIQYSKSGKKYFFVSDEMRVLIRTGEIYSCGSDPGEVGDSKFGPEGHCGFEVSIGTYSPRQSCPFRSDGSMAVGETACSGADEAKSMADSTTPTDYSLRRPGKPKIVGDSLYIPDAGNARVVRLSNFEEKIKTCGKLLLAGSTTPNFVCHFDLVLGQKSAVADPDDPSRFTARSCIRGGERGGMDGATTLATAAPFLDPATSGGTGGAACRLDSYLDTVPTVPVLRRYRQAGDFKDDLHSQMSPETGLLSEETKRMFRAPMAIETDSKGRLYVLDHGQTRARSPVGDSEATLPPRIMVWTRDPMTFQKCVPQDPLAATPSCLIDQDGICQGTGCVDRQCDGAECNASFAMGQSNILYGFTHQTGQTLDEVNPEGYQPITAFAVSSIGDMAGVWAVTGRDARMLHYRNPSQTDRPTVHNAKTGVFSDEPVQKTGVFSGITLDQAGGFIIGWDALRQIGMSWYGDLPGVTVAADAQSALDGQIINISNVK